MLYKINVLEGTVPDMIGTVPYTHMGRVGQNRVYTTYMTVYLVISLPKIPCIHRVYMILANPTHGPHFSACKASAHLVLFVAKVFDSLVVYERVHHSATSLCLQAAECTQCVHMMCMCVSVCLCVCVSQKWLSVCMCRHVRKPFCLQLRLTTAKGRTCKQQCAAWPCFFVAEDCKCYRCY